jgi:hypothetical protein
MVMTSDKQIEDAVAERLKTIEEGNYPIEAQIVDLLTALSELLGGDGVYFAYEPRIEHKCLVIFQDAELVNRLANIVSEKDYDA